RNAASLAAWLLNVPREALRMIVTGSWQTGVLWALSAAVPAAAFLYLAGGSGINRARWRQAAPAALFVIVGYGPYFFLARQSYEYYAQVSMVLPAVLLARGLMLSDRANVAAVFLAISSIVAVEGSRWIEYPGLIDRARWAETQLSAIAAMNVSPPLYVRVNNVHRFYAVGVSGLAWRLGLSESDIAIVDKCPVSGRLLEDRRADLGWTDCRVRSAD
ncbi:MAG: hypothetical protein M3Z96_01610, partial [Pseudomonadota bacterium]|nr:hypothetical protein [Pseudomonadota bacterium]